MEGYGVAHGTEVGGEQGQGPQLSVCAGVVGGGGVDALQQKLIKDSPLNTPLPHEKHLCPVFFF